MNTWLKDETPYCNNCDTDFFGQDPRHWTHWEHCCEDPFITNNMNVARLIVDQNKELRKSRKNKYASDDEKNMRLGASLPARLYHTLNQYCMQHGEPGLFYDKYDVIWFCKKFPMFSVPETI